VDENRNAGFPSIKLDLQLIAPTLSRLLGLPDLPDELVKNPSLHEWAIMVELWSTGRAHRAIERRLAAAGVSVDLFEAMTARLFLDGEDLEPALTGLGLPFRS
jgi:hypothetical protein